MPIPIVITAVLDGVSSLPWLYTALKALLVLAVLYLFRQYFQGASNGSERKMHGKVVMITGGTSGIGAEVVQGLASRGAQIILLTQHALTDPFLVEHIEDLRIMTANELITAEQVDLSSLHSIRTFATKWIDNAPPRRLDMIILCANTITPKGGKLQSTQDDVEINWGINYLANFHLLSILSPAIRAQPPDRDVRILVGSCVSYLAGEFPVLEPEANTRKSAKPKPSSKASKSLQPSSFNASSAYATSKLAVMTFALAFQKHISAYARPDKEPMNARVMLIDPGFTRTPGMRRYLSWGSLTGLLIYMVMYPIWWTVLKSPSQGAQSFLYAAMEAQWGRGEGGCMIKECREVKMGRYDLANEAVQKSLWEYSENMVQEAEKRGALARAKDKKEAEDKKMAEDREKLAKAQQPKAKEEAAKTPGSRRSKKA